MDAFNELNRVLKEKYKEQIPLPIIALAKDLDLEVFESEDLFEWEAGTLRKKDGRFIIYVNAKHYPARQRFTIAHQIGHYLMHGKKDQERMDLVKYLESGLVPENYTGMDYENMFEAYKFALNLLLPKKQFVEIFNKSKTLDEIARFFAVPKEIVAIRANNIFSR